MYSNFEPRWMRQARLWVGTKEIPGPKHSSVIMGWVKRLGRKLGIAVADDETPWCGTFVAFVMDICGIETPPVAVRASAWAAWGIPLSEPSPGAVLVFTRNGGGHVGFYVGEDEEAYHVLGGNQSNSVNITRISKSRLAAIRWPANDVSPLGGRQLLAVSGQPVSKNEA